MSLACLLPIGSAIAQTTSIVDVTDTGMLPECPTGQQLCYSVKPAISPDARFIAFESTVPGLVPGRPAEYNQVFLHDRDTCTTTRISQTTDGTPANGDTLSPAVSANGSIVAFETSATNLVSQPVTAPQIVAYDAAANAFELISRSDDGTPGNNVSATLQMSADGRWVVFTSRATNLVADDTNGVMDVFIHDRQLHTTKLLSRGPDGSPGDGTSNRPYITRNGRFVSFDSLATNFDPNPTNGGYQAYLIDRDADGNGTFDEPGGPSLVRVSVNDLGEAANGALSTWAVASEDGTKVAFSSEAANLVAGDTNGVLDVFVRDIPAQRTTRESVGPAGQQASSITVFPFRFSADGRYLTFHGADSVLAPGANGSQRHVFRRDLSTGINDIVSRAWDGTLANKTSEVGIISADGQTVAFVSAGTNLVPGLNPASTQAHVYARDFQQRPDACGITPNPWHDVVIPINSGNAFTVGPTPTVFDVDVPDTGETVIGVSFEGTIYINPLGIQGTPRTTQLTITNPDLASYVLGGDPSVETPWDFQSATATSNVTYRHGIGGDQWAGDGLPDFAIPHAPLGGDWRFSFRRVGTGANGQWRDVTITLHTMVPQIMQVSPSSLAASIPTGGSESRALTIANIGGMDLDWEIHTAISGCALPGWASASPLSGTVAGNTSTALAVAFNTTGLAVGSYGANLCLASNDASHPMVTVPLTLTVQAPPAPVLTFNPASLDFGAVRVGQPSGTLSATLRNSGNAAATGLTFQAPTNGFSIVSSNCGSTLAVGATCTSSIRFTPSAPGAASATWSVASSQGAAATLSLSGIGTSPSLQFSPTQLDFGAVVVGTTSAPQTAMLTNAGSASATVLAFSDPGHGFQYNASACPGELAVDASCPVIVTFTPTAASPATATLLAGSAEGVSAELNLAGAGVGSEIFRNDFE